MNDRSNTKRAIRKAFDGAAQSYDSAASVQREICAHLSMLAAGHGLAGARRVLDVGCGTGYGLDALGALAPAAQRIALDFAPAMLQSLKPDPQTQPLCADLEAMPLADACIDAVWSSLALQWSTPARAFAEMARVLCPGGRAWLASLGPATFIELRDAFRTIDDARHVIDFHSAQAWQQAARLAGFRILAAQQQHCFARAPSLRGLLHDIREIGAHSLGNAPRKPMTRTQWRTLETAYEVNRQHDGQLPATYDVILLALEKPEVEE